MLAEKLPTITIFKLSTGDEIITKVISEDTNRYFIEKPLQMAMSSQGFQFIPALIMSNPDKEITLSKDKIVFTAVPLNEILTQYEQLTSSIALPKKDSLIV